MHFGVVLSYIASIRQPRSVARYGPPNLEISTSSQPLPIKNHHKQSFIPQIPSNKKYSIVDFCSANNMGVQDPSQEASGTPDPVEKGFATLNSIRYAPKSLFWPSSPTYVLRIGVKVFVEKVCRAANCEV